jgi:hypothetical protein
MDQNFSYYIWIIVKLIPISFLPVIGGFTFNQLREKYPIGYSIDMDGNSKSITDTELIKFLFTKQSLKDLGLWLLAASVVYFMLTNSIDWVAQFFDKTFVIWDTVKYPMPILTYILLFYFTRIVVIRLYFNEIRKEYLQELYKKTYLNKKD